MDREIVLIRHGKPKSAHNQKVNAAGFASWVRQYNQSALDPDNFPQEKRDVSQGVIISSSLKRARLSAEYYTQRQPTFVMPSIKEMDIPYYKLPLKLKAWHWVLLNRTLWVCGLKGKFEAFHEAKQRVKEAAQHLHALSQKEPRLVIFGHGMSNRYLRIYLKQLGWHVEEKSNVYWGVTRLTIQCKKTSALQIH